MQESEKHVLGMNLFGVIMDEANFERPPVLPAGTPVRHFEQHDVVGVVKTHFFEGKRIWYVIDWLKGGFAPQMKKTWVRELPSEMHLLASF